LAEVSARRRQFEDLVVTAVQGALPYLSAVAPYAGELASKELSEVYDRLRGRVPAVLVATGDSRSDLDIQPRHLVKAVDVDLYLVSGNMRSREDKLRDDDAGIYQIAEDLEKLLVGRDVGIAGIGRLSFVTEAKMVHAPDLAIWHVRYRVPFDVQATEPMATPLLDLVGSLYQSLDEDPSHTAPPVARANRSLP
jgi:Domain of unknown function (DUF1834)